MIVRLFQTQQMYGFTLPAKVKGQYWITDFDQKGRVRKLATIEAQEGFWYLKPRKGVVLWNSGKKESQTAYRLDDAGFFYLRIEETDESAILFAEDVSNENQTLVKYTVKEPTELLIGRNEGNHIRYDYQYVSGHHAGLFFDGKNWVIKDEGSKNGTYVNGKRIHSEKLAPGDLIYIMGLKIVIGGGFIAVNNPRGQVQILSTALSVYEKQQVTDEKTLPTPTETEFFSRSPRFHREVEHALITIDPPPTMQKPDTVPMALMLGPSLTMGMTSISTGVLTVTNTISNGGNMTQALPTLIMSVGMLLGTILWPILTKQYEKRQKIKAEKERKEKYIAYLDGIREAIQQIEEEQKQILQDNLVSSEECASRITGRKTNLWERVIGQTDFLRLRVGMGTLSADIEIKCPEKHFTMENDCLQDSMFDLSSEPTVLKEVPVSFGLKDSVVSGIYGEKRDTDNLLKLLILQMVSLHSYDELKIMLIIDETEAPHWEFVRYIPHFWSNDKKVRFFAKSQDDVKELSSFISAVILPRATIADNAAERDMAPYYVIITTSNALAKKCDGIQDIINEPRNLGCTVLQTTERVSDFAKETKHVIFANGAESRIFDKDDTTGRFFSFSADHVREETLNEIGDALAKIELDLSAQTYTLPSMITFLELFGVGKVEQLNSLARWKEHNPTKSLQTSVGLDAYGEQFFLDLHEKYHGPHGLVAGMTGSGKSEFLITFILSLAVNYHPDEVSFVLIDYKGGGLAGAFENKEKGVKLPHLAGVITNLDGAALNRMLVSFQSERRRRESIFNSARKIANEGTMDIYKYQQLYRDKIVSEPVPHLFIIADEFAELKQQQPEFMDQLISLARVGRSLGIHLVLATQKPSGVVDDQIWSNSKFRVCLKVQERSDSQDVIKRPDAAALSQTGRFYLQVGYNEVFAMGQSAWCGADYLPTESIEKTVDRSIQVIDDPGRVIMNVKPAKTTVKKGSTKQVVAIVDYLSELAREEHISVRSLWLESIPASIFVEELEKKYHHMEKPFVLNPVIGEYDDPFNQRQGILTVPFSTEGNCILFGSTGSGKTAFLTTLCYSLLRHHSSEELNLYIMDFGAATLKVFEKAPQVGDVVLSSETEKVVNLLKMLKHEIDNRKELLSDFGGDFEIYHKSGKTDLPNMVVILNDYAAFAELYEDYQDDFSLLTRDGIKYGVYFIISASSVHDVRYKTQQNFKQSFSLQLNDQTDYMLAVGKTDGLMPSKFKGRGLVPLDRVYEFQTAYATDSSDQMETLRNYCSELLMKSPVVQAKKIPVLPTAVNYKFLQPYLGKIDQVPVGVFKSDLSIATFNLTSFVVFPVICQTPEEAGPFCEVLIKILSEITKTTIIDAEKVLSDRNERISIPDYSSFTEEIFFEMANRNNAYKDANLDETVLEQFERRVIILVGIRKYFEMLSEDGKDKFLTLIDKAQAIYKIHFIVVDSDSQIRTLCNDGRFRHQVDGTEGVWMGSGITDSNVFSIRRITSDLCEEVESGCGYLLTHAKPRSIKLLSIDGGE